MNAVIQSEREAAAMAGSAPRPGEALRRAQTYHFLELAFAHPGEEGHEYFRRDTTRDSFLAAYAELLEGGDEVRNRGLAAARQFFEALQAMSYEEVEAAHIGLFSSNFPHLPCPPYGSLFTATDSDKRLGEMLAIKDFYHRNGVDIAETFTDLPDHLCVELEFTQLLCFRESDALAAGDAALQVGARLTQAEFLDRFLLPLANSLADLAAGAMPENPYSHLLEAMRCFLAAHRRSLGAVSETQQKDEEIPS